MTPRKTLSVLIPAYNAESFVGETLESIRNQSFGDFRAYVSVDKSNDQTLAKCIEYTKGDPRFQVIESSERLGWVGNSNLLLRMVETPYAVFAFHDDVLHPSYFKRLVAALEENTTAAIAFSDTLLTTPDGATEHWVYQELEDINDPITRAVSILNRKGTWWVPNRGIFRHAMTKKINGLKTHESGEYSADLPWLFHMSLYGSFVRIPETLCFKNYKTSSLSRSWDFNQKASFDVLASCMRELWLADVPVDLKLKVGIPLMNFLIKNHTTS